MPGTSCVAAEVAGAANNAEGLGGGAGKEEEAACTVGTRHAAGGIPLTSCVVWVAEGVTRKVEEVIVEGPAAGGALAEEAGLAGASSGRSAGFGGRRPRR